MARKLEVRIVGDASSLERTFASVGGASAGFGSKMQGAASRLGTFLKLAAGAYVLRKAYDGLKDLTHAAEANQVAIAKTKTAVDNAGISWQKHAKIIETVLDRQARMSGFMRADLSDSFANMIRTTGNVTDALKLNAVAMDIARTKGMDLGAAQSLLARVYNGSYTGLKRLGIAIPVVTTAQDALTASGGKHTKAELDAAKAADKHATALEALGIVQQKFAGQAQAYGKTAAGAQDRFRVAVDELKAALGDKLLPILTHVDDVVMQHWPQIASVANRVFGAIVSAAKTAISYLQRNWPQIKATMIGVWNAVEPYLKRIGAFFNTELGRDVAIGVGAFAVLSKISGPLQHMVGAVRVAINAVRLILANPWAGFIAGLAILAVEVYRHWDEIVSFIKRKEIEFQISADKILSHVPGMGDAMKQDIEYLKEGLHKLDLGDYAIKLQEKLVKAGTDAGVAHTLALKAAMQGGSYRWTKAALDAADLLKTDMKEHLTKGGAEAAVSLMDALATGTINAKGHLRTVTSKAVDDGVIAAVGQELAKIPIVSKIHMQSMERAIVDRTSQLHAAGMTYAAAAKKAVDEQMAKLQASAQRGGAAAATGLGAGMRDMAPQARSKTQAAITAVSGLDGAASAAGTGIGSGIAVGVESALSGLASTMVAKVSAAISGMKAALGIHSPSTVTRDQVGKPLGEGVLLGYLEGTASLPAKLASSVVKAIDAAKNAVLAMQGQLTNAWSQLAQDALSAYDAATQAGLDKIDRQAQARIAAIQAKYAKQTPSEKKLSTMRRQDELAGELQNYNQALADVTAKQQAYNDAVAQYGADSDQAKQAAADLAASQQQLAAVERQNQETELQHQADAERAAADRREAAAAARAQRQADNEKKQYQAERDLQRRHFEQMLNELEQELEKHPEKWKKLHGKLMVLFGHFGVTFKSAGANLGKAFATGLAESLSGVEKFAKKLAQLIDDYLHVKSPTKKGPMSTLDKWWTRLPDTLIGGADTSRMATFLGQAARPNFGAARLARGGYGFGSYAGSAGADIHVHFHGGTFIGSSREKVAAELAPHIIEPLKRESRRNLALNF